jgi:CheY-like chemotaxis protein
VKKILALFHSSIQLESSPGVGSRFFFTLSFATTPGLTETTILAPADSAHLSSLRILIAEDNSVNRLLLKKQLERLNLQAVMVENGKQAYAACLSDQYDVIFMDLQMPESDGYETLKQIQALEDPAKANVYTIAFTASVTEQDKIFAAGFNDFLYKPVNNTDLREKLEKSFSQTRVAV